MEIIYGLFLALKEGLSSEQMTIPIVDITMWQLLIGVLVLKFVIEIFRFLLAMPGQQFNETKQPIPKRGKE